ncbi:MAG: zinc-ribbon domain-containing protein [Rubrimonas sp.]
MRVTCPACGAQYAPPEGSIPPEGRAVRCSSCKAEWRVQGEPAAAPAPPAPVAPEAAPEPAIAVAAPRDDVSAPDPAVVPPSQPPRRAAAVEMSASLEPEASGGGSAFMAGFATVSLLALAAIAVYANHQAVAEAIPALADPLERYAGAMDAARAWLARSLDR